MIAALAFSTAPIFADDFYEQFLVSPRGNPPEELYSTTTSDKPGLQIAFNDTLYDSLDESQYVYWIEVRLVRTTPDRIGDGV